MSVMAITCTSSRSAHPLGCPGRPSARRTGLGLYSRAAPLLRPPTAQGRAVRPASGRAKQTALQSGRCPLGQRGHESPHQRYRAAARAARYRAVDRVRALLGISSGSDLRRAAPQPGHRRGARRHRHRYRRRHRLVDRARRTVLPRRVARVPRARSPAHARNASGRRVPRAPHGPRSGRSWRSRYRVVPVGGGPCGDTRRATQPRYDDARFRLGFARQVTHCWRHSSWLVHDEIVQNAGRLAGIPGWLIHGRLDVSSPSTPRGRSIRRGPTANSSSSTTKDTAARR
jgi:hypothetical protein